MVNLVEGLSNRPDVEPIVVSLPTALDAPRVAETSGVPVYYLPGSQRLTSVTRHRSNRRVLRVLLRTLDVDVVHAQDALAYGYVCLKEGSAPVVVSVHGIVREELRHVADLPSRIRTAIFAVSLERYCVTHALYLTQPTRYPERYFGDRIHGKIVDVGNPISDRFFDVSREPVSGRVVCAGAVIPRKRLHDLIQALAVARSSTPAVHLRVAGATPDARYLESVRQRIHAYGLESVVTFLGPLSPDELVAEYRAASLCVLPSGQETSPMVIGECMAMGVPVVATAVGGVPDLIDDRLTGFLVAPGNVAEMGRRIAAVLADDVLASRLGEAGRQKAEREFRAAAVASSVVGVYRQAMERCH